MDTQLLSSLLSSLNAKTIHKGKQYARAGNVTILHSNFDEVRAEVQGSLASPYLVTINKEKKSSLAVCSCPLRHHCKHIAALLTHLLAQPKTIPVKIEEQLTFTEQQWLNELEQTTEVAKPSASYHLLYILKKKYASSQKIDIHLHLLKLKKAGGYAATGKKCFVLEDFLQNIPKNLKNALTDVDWKILQKLWLSRSQPSDTSHTSGSADSSEHLPNFLIKEIVDTGKCYWEEVSEFPLKWQHPKKGNLAWCYQNVSQLVKIQSDSENLECVLFYQDILYIDPVNHSIGPLTLPIPVNLLHKLTKHFPFTQNRLRLIQQKLKEQIPHLEVQEKQFVQIKDVRPIPICKISAKQDWAKDHLHYQISIVFQYASYQVPMFPKTETKEFESKTEVIQIYRHSKFETEVFNATVSFGWRPSWDSSQSNLTYRRKDREGDAIDIEMGFVRQAKQKGWRIELDASFPQVTDVSDLYIEATEKQNDWFELELGHKIDGKQINLFPLLREYLQSLEAKGYSFEHFKPEELQQKVAISALDGSVLILSVGRLKTIFNAFFGILNEQKGDTIRISKWQTNALNDLEHLDKLTWSLPANLQKIKQKMKETSKAANVAIPLGLKCQLREYQHEGLNWMQYLRSNDLSGILADDMGLGKTIQTLSHILLEKEEGRLQKPVLVIAPTSLMGNWAAEADRFAPDLKVLILQGNDRKKRFELMSTADLILTTYPLLAKDQEVILKHTYHLLILDEAQYVKNSRTHAAQVIQQIQSNQRICLTGTPMENHLGELWSLFHVLLPGFLGSEKQFQKLFRKPIEKEASIERRKILQNRIRPFILRRTKQEVVLELPPKTEVITQIELTSKQQDLYEAVRLTMMKKVLSEVDKNGLARSHIVLLDALLKLRQICCDPRLLKTSRDATIADSAKLVHLKEILPQLIEQKRQILLFSQFTCMIDLIQNMCDELKISYVTLTGETKDRITPIQRFQSGSVPLFLISLKAGGTGLNLTAADTVIHYDPWWNPAVENQATDRAHRIGQTKPIFVYKLISTGSVEEKILSLQAKKKQLADGLFDSNNSKPLDLSMEDLEALFAPLS